jgi:hypothetical protein
MSYRDEASTDYEEEEIMTSQQEPISILNNDPVAQTLLQSDMPASLGYVWPDGTPRVTPIWFYWTGKAFVLGSPLNAPKMRVLSNETPVSLTIDTREWPYKVLFIRGTARAETVDSVFPEYTAMAKRYLGDEAGQGFAELFKSRFSQMARITADPEWVAVQDFVTRYPSAWE